MEYCAKGNLRDFLRSKRPKDGEELRQHCLEGTENDYDRVLSLVSSLIGRTIREQTPVSLL